MEKEKSGEAHHAAIELNRQNYNKWLELICMHWKKNIDISTALTTRVEPEFMMPRLNNADGVRRVEYPVGAEGDHMWKLGLL